MTYKEQAVAAALEGAFLDYEVLPSHNELETRAKALALVMGYEGELGDIIRQTTSRLFFRLPKVFR